MTRSFACCFLALLACGAGEIVRGAERAALVITNDGYPGDPTRPAPGQLCRLDSVVEDRRVMVPALQKVGFEVVALANLGSDAILDGVRAFARKYAGAQDVLFYFSGHGAQVQGENYLCGIDTDPDLGGALLELEARLRGSELDEARANLERKTAEKRSVPLRTVLASLELMTPATAQPVRIVLLDACRSPFGTLPPTKGMVFGKGGLGDAPKRAGLFIGFAAGANEEANTNDPGRPSLFTEALARRMQKPGTIHEVFLDTREEVNRRALEKIGKRQFPAYYDELERRFSFVPGATVPPISQPSQIVEPAKPTNPPLRIQRPEDATVVQ